MHAAGCSLAYLSHGDGLPGSFRLLDMWVEGRRNDMENAELAISREALARRVAFVVACMTHTYHLH